MFYANMIIGHTIREEKSQPGCSWQCVNLFRFYGFHWVLIGIYGFLLVRKVVFFLRKLLILLQL